MLASLPIWLPSGLLVDLDGTIVDSVYAHVLAWHRALRAEEIDVPAWRIHALGGRSMAAARQELERWTGRLPDDTQLLRVFRRYTQEFESFARDMGQCPGAEHLLAVARDKAVPVAVVTSATRAAAGTSMRTAPAYAAHVLVTADDAAPKPSPAPIQLAAAKLGVDVRGCWMVGDTEHDMAATRAAGAFPIGVRTGGHAPACLKAAGASIVVDDVGVVANLLASRGRADTLRAASGGVQRASS